MIKYPPPEQFVSNVGLMAVYVTILILLYFLEKH